MTGFSFVLRKWRVMGVGVMATHPQLPTLTLAKARTEVSLMTHFPWGIQRKVTLNTRPDWN